MKRVALNNGVLIEVEDLTKHLSGELYMVHIAITYSVELGEEDGDLRRYCPSGRLAVTRYIHRPGVPKKDLERVKAQLTESFLNTNIPYMEHPHFVKRFKETSLERFRKEEEKARRMAAREE